MKEEWKTREADDEKEGKKERKKERKKDKREERKKERKKKRTKRKSQVSFWTENITARLLAARFISQTVFTP